MSWQPLLAGDEANRALALVDAIADAVDGRPPDDPTLCSGWAGVALLHGYRARAGREDGEERAFAALEQALDTIDSVESPWLFDGWTGVGFVAQHLADELGEVGDVIEPIDAIAEQLLATEDMRAWTLTHGAIGLGVYGHERGLPAMVERAAQCVAALAERNPGGATWRQPELLSGQTEPHINLGLAHGVASAIAFLATTGPHELVREGVRWLRARERAEECPRYPMNEGYVELAFKGILDGWCYGDPSTALVLVRAGLLIGEPELVSAGRALAHHAAHRTNHQLSRLTLDTTLCHGAISHAHLFHRLARYLDDPVLLATAHRWTTRVLADDVLALNTRPGLQLGLSGVALGLLAAATPVEPEWDRAFLLS
jgi:hypothetical protein